MAVNTNFCDYVTTLQVHFILKSLQTSRQKYGPGFILSSKPTFLF